MNYVDIDNYIITPEEQRRRAKALKEKFYTPRPPPTVQPVEEEDPNAVRPLTYLERVRLCCPVRPSDLAPLKPGVSKARLCAGIASTYYGVSSVDVLGPRRKRKLMDARFVAMYVARHLFGMTYPMIGRQFSGRDHSSVVHAVNLIERRMSEGDDELKTAVNIIKNETLRAFDATEL